MKAETQKNIVIVALIVVAVWIPSLVGSFGVRSSQLSACERGNVSRVSELEQRQALVTVNIARVAATSGDEKAANQLALDEYRKSKRHLIKSQQEVAVEPGSVVVDCSLAYPKPFPFNISL